MITRTRTAGLFARTIALALLLAGSAAYARSEARPISHAALLHPTGYVVDQAGVLDGETRSHLEVQLRRFELETRHQFVVVTVSSLGGVDVKTFTISLGNRWGVGRKGWNDGIVLLVVPGDRKARISVGYGLTSKLSDAFCQSVLDRKMVPAFARGQWGQGIQAGVSAIIARVAGSKKLPA